MHPVFRLQQPDEGAEPPDLFSHSSLAEIETCPKRWWLLHSSYRHLGGSYPLPVSPAAVTGTVVHGVLQSFADALRRSGNPEPGTAAFRSTRQSLPVRVIVQQLRHDILDRLRGNPRVDVSSLASRVSVDNCITAFKRLVTQAYLTPGIDADKVGPGKPRIVQSSTNGLHGQAVGKQANRPITSSRPNNDGADCRNNDGKSLSTVPSPAVLAELLLDIPDPPFRGKLDLVFTDEGGDTLVEFKTGEPRPEHEEQSRVYAVLWWKATGRRVRQRLLLYPGADPVEVGGLDNDELAREEERLRRRVAIAQEVLANYPPPARPQVEICVHCPVRQLCDDYWSASVTAQNRWNLDALGHNSDIGGWRDLEAEPLRFDVSGDRFVIELTQSHKENSEQSGATRLVCNVPPKFRIDQQSSAHRARLLGVGLQREGNSMRILWSPGSELYWGKVNSA